MLIYIGVLTVLHVVQIESELSRPLRDGRINVQAGRRRVKGELRRRRTAVLPPSTSGSLPSAGPSPTQPQRPAPEERLSGHSGQAQQRSGGPVWCHLRHACSACVLRDPVRSCRRLRISRSLLEPGLACDRHSVAAAWRLAVPLTLEVMASPRKRRAIQLSAHGRGLRMRTMRRRSVGT